MVLSIKQSRHRPRTNDQNTNDTDEDLIGRTGRHALSCVHRWVWFALSIARLSVDRACIVHPTQTLESP